MAGALHALYACDIDRGALVRHAQSFGLDRFKTGLLREGEAVLNNSGGRRGK